MTLEEQRRRVELITRAIVVLAVVVILAFTAGMAYLVTSTREQAQISAELSADAIDDTAVAARQARLARRIAHDVRDQGIVNGRILARIQQQSLVAKQANKLIQSCSVPGKPCYQRELRMRISIATCIDQPGSMTRREMSTCVDR